MNVEKRDETFGISATFPNAETKSLFVDGVFPGEISVDVKPAAEKAATRKKPRCLLISDGRVVGIS
jgi:hypothetical protein